jgi:GTPase SAR1 family protein
MQKNKVVLLGDSGAGKTNFATRLTTNTFIENIATTVGAQFHLHTINNKDEKIKLEIWDTAGQERFRSLLPLYIRHAYIIIIVIDTSNSSNAESKKLSDISISSIYNHVIDPIYDSLLFWLSYYKENINIYNPEHFVIILFNKIDMLPEKQYTISNSVLQLLNEYNLQNNYICTSVKDNIGFDEFNKLIIHNIELKKNYEIIPNMTGNNSTNCTFTKSTGGGNGDCSGGGSSGNGGCSGGGSGSGGNGGSGNGGGGCSGGGDTNYKIINNITELFGVNNATNKYKCFGF